MVRAFEEEHRFFKFCTFGKLSFCIFMYFCIFVIFVFCIYRCIFSGVHALSFTEVVGLAVAAELLQRHR